MRDAQEAALSRDVKPAVPVGFAFDLCGLFLSLCWQVLALGGPADATPQAAVTQAFCVFCSNSQ